MSNTKDDNEVKDPKSYLLGSYDLGLGYCLQCVAEYKLGGERSAQFPRFAITMAPISGTNASGATCYTHLAVQAPQPQQMPQQMPLTPNEADALSVLMPNGQPARARHRR